MTVDQAEVPKSSGLLSSLGRLFRKAPASQERAEDQSAEVLSTQSQAKALVDTVEHGRHSTVNSVANPEVASMQASNGSAFAYPTQSAWPNLTTESLLQLKTNPHQNSTVPLTDAYQTCIDHCDPNATLAEYLKEKGPENLSGAETATILKLICKAVDKGESLVDFDNVLDRSYSMRHDSMRSSRSMRSLRPRRHRRRLVPRSSEFSVGDSASEYPSQSLISDSFWNTSKRKWAPIDENISYAQLLERGGAMSPRNYDGPRPVKRSATMSAMASHITQTAARPLVDTTMANNADTSDPESAATDIPVEADEGPTAELLSNNDEIQPQKTTSNFASLEVDVPVLPVFAPPTSEMRPLARSSIRIGVTAPKVPQPSVLPIRVDETASKAVAPVDSMANSDQGDGAIAVPSTNAFTGPQSKKVTYEVQDLSADEGDDQTGAPQAETFNPTSAFAPAAPTSTSKADIFAPNQQNAGPQDGPAQAMDELKQAQSSKTNKSGSLAQETPESSSLGSTFVSKIAEPKFTSMPNAPLAERPAASAVSSVVPAPNFGDEKMTTENGSTSLHPEQDSNAMEMELEQFDALFDATPQGSASVLPSNLEGEISQIEVEYDFS